MSFSVPIRVASSRIIETSFSVKSSDAIYATVSTSLQSTLSDSPSRIAKDVQKEKINQREFLLIQNEKAFSISSKLSTKASKGKEFNIQGSHLLLCLSNIPIPAPVVIAERKLLLPVLQSVKNVAEMNGERMPDGTIQRESRRRL